MKQHLIYSDHSPMDNLTCSQLFNKRFSDDCWELIKQEKYHSDRYVDSPSARREDKIILRK